MVKILKFENKIGFRQSLFYCIKIGPVFFNIIHHSHIIILQHKVYHVSKLCKISFLCFYNELTVSFFQSFRKIWDYEIKKNHSNFKENIAEYRNDFIIFSSTKHYKFSIYSTKFII